MGGCGSGNVKNHCQKLELKTVTLGTKIQVQDGYKHENSDMHRFTELRFLWIKIFKWTLTIIEIRAAHSWKRTWGLIKGKIEFSTRKVTKVSKFE
jgi:hypothetical protein